MHALDLQMLRRMVLTFALILAVVALSATLSQAARLTEDIIERGLSLRQFGLLLLTLTPKMAELVTPLVFGLALILACVHRNEAGTTLLLRAAGRAPLRDALLLVGFSVVMAAGLLAVSSAVVPLSQVSYRNLYAQAQQEGLARFDLPAGQPIKLGSDIVLRAEQHLDDGLFAGVVALDHSQPGMSTLLLADRARLANTAEGRTILSLENGLLQRTTAQGGTTELRFAATNLPIALPQPPALGVTDRADTQSTPNLLAQGRNDAAAREELVRRLAAGLSMISFSLLVASILFSGRPAPEGQARPSIALILVLIVFLMLQAVILSGPGFSAPTAGLVLAIAASPLILSPIIRIGRRFAR